MFVVSLFSSIASEYHFSVYGGYLLDDFMQTIGLLYLFIWSSQHKNFDMKIVFKSIIIVSCIIYIFGIIEYVTQQNIYKILGIDNLLNDYYFGNQYRDNIYRISSIFPDTLQFGYYLALMFPVFWMVIQSFHKGIYRNLALFCFVLSIPLIYFTNSRTPVFMLMISIALWVGYTKLWKTLFRSKREQYFFFISICCFSAISIFYIEDMINFISTTILGIEIHNVGGDGSFNVRASELDIIYSNVEKGHIFLGLGRINTFDIIKTTQLDALDSMWIRLFLESGILSPILFLILLITPLVRSIRSIVNSKSKAPVNIYLLMSFITFIIMTTFSSNHEMRIIFYTLLIIQMSLIKTEWPIWSGNIK